MFELFKSILKILHPLFSIDCGVLTVYDSKVTTISRAYVSAFDPASEEICEQIVAVQTALTPFQKEVAGFTFPVLKSKDEWVAELGENHHVTGQTGEYQYHCYIPLEFNNQVLGTFELHNLSYPLSTECLSFCSSLADILTDLLHKEHCGLFSATDLPHLKEISASAHAEARQQTATDLLPNKLLEKLTAVASRDELSQPLAEVAELFKAESVIVLRKDAEENLVHPYIIIDVNGEREQLLSEKFSAEETLFKEIDNAAGKGLLLDSGDAKGTLISKLGANKLNRHGVAATALKHQDEVIGYLIVCLKDSKILSDELLHLLQRLGIFVSAAINNLAVTEKSALQQQLIKEYENKLSATQDLRVESKDFSDIIGRGKHMQRVIALMEQVASTDSTVLITGETGTGKEVVARGIHQASKRSNQPMIKINCAAIPPNLIESELFGHEKGAFTGATERREGKFELADKGTLFLDEIGELPLDMQVKLLRALQEKEIERVGGKTVIKVDVRIIAATNRDLAAEVEAGRFRRDLFYRLNVFPIWLPPLRSRKEDIPALAAHFLFRYAQKSGRQVTGFSQRALQQMNSYEWPGNVREMEHTIERLVLLATKNQITELGIAPKEKRIVNKDGVAQKVKTIDENERDHIFAVLQLCSGRISGEQGAAKLLGVPATTLNSKIKRLGLSKKHF
ncbi:sigma-54-dependent Fis family transcriptional regulator [Mucilaginibacter sp. RS28]|uniref:Sigma-54-dependent Fis family transcriptional regulator n=1 Tax=Mucilaginibacter straminoryzae TaxID=2932774 RepID=A0A9X2BA34_9SPHI|nr:sigma-54-dependent Fis family transcriptional regulator [Mucilaginibacter straminoryzae]MCJ8208367.1 sigma-54-dependent Fis family transcriptional regulator [Mucilaginibacter straminoryzae]